ncbi:NADP-dependent oxidoreductase domain-containing protein [Abortiporus biennis]|nr:NADP-dependent oxidoreductase domain-containing protein [Abortiporus biennis]
MSFYDRPPFPKTKLGIHRLHVSPIQLGAMSIGDKWEALGHGTMNKETSFKLLDAFYDAGGNFIDTANNYQDESSEEFIGEWMEERGIRDQIVIATKFTTNFKRGNQSVRQQSQYTGNNTKSLHISVEASLKKLRTDYIDILYLHWWDYDTPIEEVMNSLHNLVASGKVLYLHRFESCLLQERSKGPKPYLTDKKGVGNSSSTSQLTLHDNSSGRTISGPDWERTPVEVEVSHALEKVAQEIGAKTINAVAIAYVMQKAPYVFPIIGGRKIEHLHSNLEALDLRLEKKHIDFLESVVPLDLGFPYGYFGNGTDYNMLFKTAGYFEKWPVQEAIKPIPQAEGTK